jgi:oxygen-independent coproporphyrinogen-3 oxidase
LREGIDLQRFAALADREPDPARVAALTEAGLIETVNGTLRVTAAGFPLLDAIVADLAA